MLVINKKIGEFLINNLFATVEGKELELGTLEKVLETHRITLKEKDWIIEDIKHNLLKVDEQNCELKKKIMALENDKIYHTEELKKRNDRIVELGKRIEEIAKEDDILLDQKNSEIVKLENKTYQLEKRCIELIEKETATVNMDLQYNGQIIKLKQEIEDLKGKLEVATAMVGIKAEETPPPVKRGRRKGVVANGK
ncbi:hypothetical protein ACQ9ZF_05040 [Cetobacterium somerae]|uniref:hypothetical protein n=1 Tax=Cetobacterium somerae TaxID=188913 RepID=UPI003D7669A6